MLHNTSSGVSSAEITFRSKSSKRIRLSHNLGTRMQADIGQGSNIFVLDRHTPPNRMIDFRSHCTYAFSSLSLTIWSDRLGLPITENKTAEKLCALCLRSNHTRLVLVYGPTPLFRCAAAECICCFQRHLPNPIVSPLQFICTMKALNGSNWKTTRNAFYTSHENR